MWSKAREARIYNPISLKTSGYIHNSTLEQLLKTANKSYKGVKNLLLLVINTKLVTEKIVFEDAGKGGQKHPHIYGPLSIDAVERVIPFSPDENGHFTELPAEAVVRPTLD